MRNDNDVKASGCDVAIVLGAWLVKKGGKWQTATFEDDCDAFGGTGDRLRVLATAYLYQDNPNLAVIVSGGRGQLRNVKGIPVIANVLKGELVKLGVSSKNIIEETSSDNTYQNLLFSSLIIKENRFKKICVISNRYHLPRVGALIKKAAGLNALRGAILVSAEDVLANRDSETWTTVVQSAYKTGAMQKRIAAEQVGVRDIKNGTYRLE